MADSNTIQVGCTHPVGMRLHVYDWAGEGEDRALHEVGVIELAGSSDGKDAFTPVDADLFAKWMALNAETDVVKTGEVFTAGKAKAA